MKWMPKMPKLPDVPVPEKMKVFPRKWWICCCLRKSPTAEDEEEEEEEKGLVEDGKVESETEAESDASE